MTFHSIVRQWCRTYVYMLDSPKNRRFYLTDSTAGVVEMAKGIVASLSPCVVMESSVEGYMKNGLIFRNYPIYFFVLAAKMSDGDAAAVAKEKAWMHAQNFLSWLRIRHNNDPTRTKEYERVNMEDSIDVQTVGPIENGWYGVLVQLERCESTDMCVDEDLYVEDCEEEVVDGNL